METPAIFWGVILWMVAWGLIGSVALRRRYFARDLDTSNASFVGAMSGAALGPIGVGLLWARTPELTGRIITLFGVLAVVLIAAAFAFADPQNNCVANGSFVVNQITNGIIIGIIYGFMALGLTLIFSILGVVSFAHGEFYMVGGMLVYYITVVWFPGLNPMLGVLGACFIAF